MLLTLLQSIAPGGETPSKGGVGDYRRYRRDLERMVQAAEKYDRSKYKRKAEHIAEIAAALPIDLPAIKEAPALKPQEIDFSALQRELLRAISYLDSAILAKLQDNRESETDDLTLLMLLTV